MTFTGPPDSYWEPPEPTDADVYEQAEQDLDMVVAEWADGAEVEIFGVVAVTRAHEPLFQIDQVNRDGERLYDGRGFPIEFDTIDDLREWLTEQFPFIPESE